MTGSHGDRTVSIGRIHRARGVQGEMKVMPLTDFPERYEDLTSVLVTPPDGRPSLFEVTGARVRGTDVYLRLAGIEDRDAAEALRGSMLGVPESDVVDAGEDSVYFYDIEGMRMVDGDGTLIGTVVDVERYPASDILIVETDEGRIMVPAIAKFITAVDRGRGELTADLPAGLPFYPKGIR